MNWGEGEGHARGEHVGDALGQRMLQLMGQFPAKDSGRKEEGVCAEGGSTMP